MGRYNNSGSHAHHVEYHSSFGGFYRLVWFSDRYYKGSPLRFTRRCYRDTDEAGARRFCKKWNVPLPEHLQAEGNPSAVMR